MKVTILKSLFLIVFLSCSADVELDEKLSAIINSELELLFDENLESQGLADLYESNEIFIFGESHYVEEQHEFLISQLPLLSDAGYKVIHMELWHCFSWLVNDYVMGKVSELPEFILYMDEKNLEGIRKYNESVPDSKKISYKYFDVNHWPSNFINCLFEIEKIIGSQNIFSTIKSSIVDSDAYFSDLNHLNISLQERNVELISSWGKEWYDRIIEIVEAESVSTQYRTGRSNALREEFMFNTVHRDLRAVVDGKHLIYTGIAHSLTTETKWDDFKRLGTLIKNENMSAASVYFIGIEGERKERFNSTEHISFNLLESADPDDMILAIQELSQNQTAFLPLSNPYFNDNISKISNTSGNLFNTQLGTQFDGIVVIPKISVLKSMSKYEWM